MAIRDIARLLKQWAVAKGMMGQYPVNPNFDAPPIRGFFGAIGIPYATRVLQDRGISYIGINEILNEIVIFTSRKLNARDHRALSNLALAVGGGERITLQFEHCAIAQAGSPPTPPSVPAYHVHNGRYTCGSSIYIGSEKGAGTLGCLVRGADGTLYGLSNNHVSGGSNYARPGLPILAPGMADVTAGGQDPETIGHHYRAHPFVDGLPEVVNAADNLDAALFTIADEARVSSMQRGSFDTPANHIPLAVGMNVLKVGRTTGVTHGDVTSELFDAEAVLYNLDIIGGRKIVYFQSLFTIKGTVGLFSQAGDSGSLIINTDAGGIRRAVGIVVAGDENSGTCLALSLDRMLQHFGVTLVSGHNV
jgi:hypothetical protein